MSDPVEAVWVVGTFTGDRAKSVLAHAHSIGTYQILDQSGNKVSPTCTAAFRYVIDPINGVLPHLTIVRDPYKIAKYEQARIERTGGHQAPQHKSANPKRIAEIKETIAKRSIAREYRDD